MRVVVDASLAVDACLAADGFGLFGEHDLSAPPLLASEVLSALRGLQWRGDISPELATVAVERAAAMPVGIEKPAGHLVRAWELASKFGWARTYDAEYVALAVHLDVPLATADLRLARAVARVVRVVTPREL